ncbi:MAG: response regulator transcription factor [Anaerolineae bacterium]|nr:response regulator transcription factor [Anaerolineae bacterium]
MNPPRVLIVDDEPGVRYVLERTLQDEDFNLDSVDNGLDAIRKLTEAAYDLLLLDLHMTPIDGLTVFQAARKLDPDIVVIILTAYSSVESAVDALRLGAFDYLFKPIAPDMIRQRVRDGLQYRQRVVRRQRMFSQFERLRQTLSEFDAETEQMEPPPTDQRFVRSGNLVIDCHHRQTMMGNKPLDLTTAEFDLLVCLVKAAPKPLSPRELVNCALGYNAEETEARDIVKWHIHHLRRKIEDDPSCPRCIKTVRHKGYLWRGE